MNFEEKLKDEFESFEGHSEAYSMLENFQVIFIFKNSDLQFQFFYFQEDCDTSEKELQSWTVNRCKSFNSSQFQHKTWLNFQEWTQHADY